MRVKVDILEDTDSMVDHFEELSEDDLTWVLSGWPQVNGRYIMNFTEGVRLLSILNKQDDIIFELK